MDEQKSTKTVQCGPVQAWPKKYTLVVNARSGIDFIRAGQLLKQLPEDFAKYEKRPGRHNGIAYGRPKEPTIYAWYTKQQVTMLFDYHELDNPAEGDTRG